MKKEKNKEDNFAAVINEAESSKKNKTGSWRVLMPIVIYDKCTGCKICAGFCPEGCITITRKKARINLDYCKGCGICAVECPTKAIHMEVVKK